MFKWQHGALILSNASQQTVSGLPLVFVLVATQANIFQKRFFVLTSSALMYAKNPEAFQAEGCELAEFPLTELEDVKLCGEEDICRELEVGTRMDDSGCLTGGQLRTALLLRNCLQPCHCHLVHSTSGWPLAPDLPRHEHSCLTAAHRRCKHAQPFGWHFLRTEADARSQWLGTVQDYHPRRASVPCRL